MKFYQPKFNGIDPERAEAVLLAHLAFAAAILSTDDGDDDLI